MAAKFVRSIMLLTILSATFLLAAAQPPGGMPKAKNEQIKNKWLDIAYAQRHPRKKWISISLKTATDHFQ